MGYQDLEVYRKEFPVTQELIYLNHAAIAPLCRKAAEAMKFLANDAAHFGSLHYETWLETYAGLRQSGARLIGATPDEIALVKNTSEGISIVALGFPWRSGDRVVGFREEFPSNYFPWKQLESRGVTVSWLSIYDPIETIAAAVDGARLLAISFVNYLSGFRVNLRAVGDCCRQSGCFFFVDAIQGLGVYPLDVEEFHIDALSADGHKWLLGPEGNGILYVRREWQDRIQPTEFGWMNRARAGDYEAREMVLRSDAGRYECGTLNTIGCFGLSAALEFVMDVGIERIGEAVDGLATQMERGATAKGYQVLRPRSDENGSGIVSVKHPAIESRVIASELQERGMIAATRAGWLRFAPHFYIRKSEIDEVLESLPAA